MADTNDFLNKGIDLDALLRFRERVINDSSNADRRPQMAGKWNGEDEAIITFGDKQVVIGGNDHLNAMQTLLAAFIACDIDVVAMNASFLGIKIEELVIEASGSFNVQSYIGAADTPGSGYKQIDYKVRLKAPGITEEQVKQLIEKCEKASPVGDTLIRSVPVKLEFITS
jgi:uncharacterized OsmC-like protein